MPWGQGFTEPLFEGVFELLDFKTVGEKHLKMTLKPQGGTSPIEAIKFFFHDEYTEPAQQLFQSGLIKCAYRCDVNVFRDQAKLQLILQVLEPM